MTFHIPSRDDVRWLSAQWRTGALLQLMDAHKLTAEDVGTITGHKKMTVYCWRTSAVRPISVNDLKALMFELARSHEQA